MLTAAYARYSTTNQTENGIAAQLDGIIKFCQQNQHTIVQTFIDEAQTGTNTNRQGFMQLLDGARHHQFEAVVIYDILRGSRDVADWFNFRKEMQSCGIKILPATEHLGDISNPNDFLVELINVGLGQHMVLQTRQKSIAGTAQRAKEGVFLGGTAPLGYDIDNGHYIINNYEAEAVKLIFDLYAKGHGYKYICNQLAARGFKSKRGALISANAARMILRNERYVGVYKWNERKCKYMGKLQGGKENPDVVRIEGAIPAIIDKETWEKVVERMNNGTRTRLTEDKIKHEYLLSGLIRCEQCGASFSGNYKKIPADV